MTIDRVNLPSLAYWRGERQPQRFYVAFCLFMSAVQDRLLAERERESANLNWSATCSYYALVHGGRLLTFLALGDFPTSHLDLRRVLGRTPDRSRRRRRAAEGYPFDWLRGFTEEITEPTRRPDQGASPGLSQAGLRDGIVTYLTEIGVGEPSERLDRFGDVLAAAAELRNDSNYEALLIAHEYGHTTMTSAFESLAIHMAGAAEVGFPVVQDAFTRFVEADPDLEANRLAYVAFARDYLHCRLLTAIGRKLEGFPALCEKLRHTVDTIRLPESGADYRDLEHRASLDVFGSKARLMSGFESKIEELRRATEDQLP